MQGHTWKRRMPSVADPDLVASCPLSPRSWRTNADEDSESATAMTSASSQEVMAAIWESANAKFSRSHVPTLLPKGYAKATKTAVVTKTWTVPRPNAYVRKALRRSDDSSSPISKRRKSTPSSASCPNSLGDDIALQISGKLAGGVHQQMPNDWSRLRQATSALIAQTPSCPGRSERAITLIISHLSHAIALVGQCGRVKGGRARTSFAGAVARPTGNQEWDWHQIF